MNNTALAGLIVGAVVVSAVGAVAVNSGFNPWQKYANVVAVEPAFDTSRVPRQVCGDEAALELAKSPGATPAAEQPQAENAKQPQSGQTAETGDESCVVVYDVESIPAGYDVTYELDGVQKVVRMDRDPGDRIPVEDGEVVLSQL